MLTHIETNGDTEVGLERIGSESCVEDALVEVQ